MRVFLHQLRNRRFVIDVTLDVSNMSNAKKRLVKHQQRLHSTSKKIQMIYLAILVGLAENAPFGILQLIYSIRVAQIGETMDALTTISVLTTWCMMGLKVHQHVCVRRPCIVVAVQMYFACVNSIDTFELCALQLAKIPDFLILHTYQ